MKARSSDSSDELPLTQEEIDKILKAARVEKARLKREKEYMESLRHEPVYPVFTAEQFKSVTLMNKRATDLNFKLNQFQTIVFDLLCCWATKDQRFAEAGYSLNKGILLYGNVGVGKTMLMQMISANPHQTFVMANCRDASSDFSKDEADPIFFYSGEISDIRARSKFGHTSVGLCFDDLGTETIPRKHFGNETNAMTDILLNRYEKRPKNMTHITTNLTAEDIKNTYGLRASDRMREMFNLIAFPTEAKSMRA